MPRTDGDVKKSKYEEKWSIHWECKEAVEDILDRSTPGATRTRLPYKRPGN